VNFDEEAIFVATGQMIVLIKINLIGKPGIDDGLYRRH
jgi:hypothetical protein